MTGRQPRRRRAWTDSTHPDGDDSGAVAGAEILLFGALVFVALFLVFAQAWRIYEAEAAATAGARQATRTYVDSDGGSVADATNAGLEALVQLGHHHGAITVHAASGFVRCGVVVAEATVVVPELPLPLVGSLLGHTAAARHSELIDPLRSGLAGDPLPCLDSGP